MHACVQIYFCALGLCGEETASAYHLRLSQLPALIFHDAVTSQTHILSGRDFTTEVQLIEQFLLHAVGPLL